VRFNAAPAAGASIVISDTSIADFKIVDDHTVIIKPILQITNGADTNLKIGDTVTIVQYSNHDMYDMRTQVFRGSRTFNNQTAGWDIAGYDSVGYDTTGIIVISNPVYDLSRPVNKAQFLQVFLNGVVMDPAYDFKLLSPTKLQLGLYLVIKSTDLIQIRHFSENTRVPTIRWRQFKDLNDTVTQLGIDARKQTKLVKGFLFGDEDFVVENADLLSEPGLSSRKPGVVFINGERITYWRKYSTGSLFWTPNQAYNEEDVVRYADPETFVDVFYKLKKAGSAATIEQLVATTNAVVVDRNGVDKLRRSSGGTGGKNHPAGSLIEDACEGYIIPGTTIIKIDPKKAMQGDNVWYNTVAGGQTLVPASKTRELFGNIATTSGTVIISGISSTADLKAGRQVYQVDGTGTFCGTATIASVDSKTQISLTVSTLSGTITGDSGATTIVISGIPSTLALKTGMRLVKVSGSGAFGGTAIITSVDGLQQITVTTDSANTNGTIVFRAYIDGTIGFKADMFDSGNYVKTVAGPLTLSTSPQATYLKSISR
jgi:hypothetical protein